MKSITYVKGVILSVLAMQLMACQSNTITLPNPATPPVHQTAGTDAHNQVLIVMFQPTINMTQLRQVIEANHGSVVYHYNVIHGMAIRFPDNSDMAGIKQALSQVDGVASVENDSVQTIQPVTNK